MSGLLDDGQLLVAPVRTGTLRRDLAITVAALLVVLAWDLSGLDLAAVRLYGDETGFAWRDAVLTRSVLHDGGRWVGFAVLSALVVNVSRPLWPGPTRRERVRWLAVTLVCLLAVPALKQLSTTSCPWDLAEFGGTARHVSHWHVGLSDGGPGRCFPSGHATAAFAFFSGWFALRPHHPRAARRWLVAVLAFGLAFGWAQLARGAHYPSHTLWSAWLCWAMATATAPRPPRPPQGPAANTAS